MSQDSISQLAKRLKPFVVKWINDATPSGGAGIASEINDHGQLLGLGDDDHTQYLLDNASTAGDGLEIGSRVLSLGTPGTLTVSSSNAVSTASHTHAITSSSNPGATASILASDASGYLQLIKLALNTTPNYTLDVNGQTYHSFSTSTTGTLIGHYFYTTRTGETGSLFGLLARTRIQIYNGNAGYAYGLRAIGSAYNNASDNMSTGDIVGGYFEPEFIMTGTGNLAISGSMGVSIAAPTITATGGGTLSITNQRGILIANQGNAYTTNAYGIFINSQSGATNNYSLYTVGGIVLFGDRVILNGSQDVLQFKIHAHSTQNQNLVLIDSYASSPYFVMNGSGDIGLKANPSAGYDFYVYGNERIQRAGAQLRLTYNGGSYNNVDFYTLTSGDLQITTIADQAVILENAGINSLTWVSQTTGWGITYAGAADFRSIYADELYVKSFIAEIYSALVGALIITKSRAKLSQNFTVPIFTAIVGVDTGSEYFSIGGDQTSYISGGDTFVVSGSTGNDGTWTVDSVAYDSGNDETDITVTGDITDATVDGNIGFQTTLYVEDLDDPTWADTAVFEDNDYVLLRIMDFSGGGLVIANVWGTVASYSDETGGEQSWTFTCVDDGSAPWSVIYTGSIVLDYGASGDGVWEVTVLDPAGSPYSQITTWTSDPSNPANFTTHVRVGNLDGISGIGAEYGFWAGQGTASDDPQVILTDSQANIRNIDLTIHDGTNEVIVLDYATPYFAIGGNAPTAFDTGVGIWMGNDSAVYKFRVGDPAAQQISWDGTNMEITGSLTVADGSVVVDNDAMSLTRRGYSVRYVVGSEEIGSLVMANYNDGGTEYDYMNILVGALADASMTNPGFEDALTTGWTVSTTNATASRVGSGARTGTYRLYTNVEDNPLGAEVIVTADSIAVSANDTVYVSFWYTDTAITGTNATISVEVHWLDAGSSVISLAGIYQVVDTGTGVTVSSWTKGEVQTEPAPSNAAYVRIRVYGDSLSVSSATAYFDDFDTWVGTNDGNIRLGNEIVSITATTIKINGILSVTGDGRFGGGVYSGSSTGDAPTGTVIATDYGAFSGGVYVGANSDPGTDNLYVDGQTRLAGGLYVGSTGTAPAAGTITSTDYMVALGGLHVGGTSDPGTDNLIVDLEARIGDGIYVGGTGTAVAAGDVVATADGRFGGGMYIGSTASDPAAGTLTVTDFAMILGGLHVGGTSDPGTDNLFVDGFYRLPASSELTISGGAITVTKSLHTVDTEGDASSDSLVNINGGTEGDILVLRSANATRTVTLVDNTGNLRLAGNMDLDATGDTITLYYDGAGWIELSRSNNA